MSLDNIADISQIVIAVGVLGIFAELLVSYRAQKADHERSRRERSIELLLQWSKFQNKDTASTRRLVENLSREQCRALDNREPISIPTSQKRILIGLFGEKSLKLHEDKNIIVLSEEQVSQIRSSAIRYLNQLESILAAWQHHVADAEIIENEFAYLFSPESGSKAMQNFRLALGWESFPAIEMFIEHLETKRREGLRRKRKIS